MSDNKKRILIISDSVTRKTGYSTVAKNIIKRLAKKYDIAQLGLADNSRPIPDEYDIDYYSLVKVHKKCCTKGQIIEYHPRGSNEVQYLKMEKDTPKHEDQNLCIKGSNLQQDNYAYISVYWVVQHFKPDIVMPINDVWGLYNIVHLRNRKAFKFMPYIAIDSECMFPQIDVPSPGTKLPPVNPIQTINDADYPVVFTDWAQGVLNKTAKLVTGKELNKMYTIPHGVDTSVWHPIDNARRQELRTQHFKVDNKVFLIGCFLKDTPVLMSDLSYKPIQDIEKGDKVINHLGKQDTVVAPDPKHYDGDIYKIEAAGLLEPIEATQEHPFYTINRANLKRWKQKNKITVRGQIEEKTPQWTAIKDIKLKDFIIEPIVKKTIDVSKLDTTPYIKKFNGKTNMLPKTIPLDKEFMRFLGLFVAEGSFQYFYKDGKKHTESALNISLNSKETDLIDFIVYYAKKRFNITPNVRIYFRNNLEFGHVTIELNGGQLHRFIKDQLIGTHCQTKRLKQMYMFLPKEKQESFLQGWIEGDGHVAKDNRIIIGTTCKDMAVQAGVLFARTGQPYSIIIDDKSRISKNYSKQYKVTTWTHKERCQSIIVTDTNIYRRVNNITHYKYSGKVYNFEVKDENTYVTSTISVHNSIARAQPRKRLDALLMVLKLLKDNYEKKVGKKFIVYFHCSLQDRLGWPLPWLAQYYGVLDRCIFDKNLRPGEGPTDEQLNELACCMDAHVVLTNSEGFLLPALETLAAGVPNILTDYSAHADWGKDAIYLCKVAAYEHEPKTGFIKAIASNADCAKKISLLAGSKKFSEEWSKKGIKLGNKLDWDNVVQMWEKLIDSIDISDLDPNRFNDPFMSNPTAQDFSLKHFPKEPDDGVVSATQLR